MTSLLHYVLESELRGRVEAIHSYYDDSVKIGTWIEVEDIPNPTPVRKKYHVLYVNPSNGEMWYEYFDRPETDQEKIEALQEELLKKNPDEYFKSLNIETTDLESYKTAKIDQLNHLCNTCILAGFESDALGTVNAYGFNFDDQINLGGMLNAISAELQTSDIIWKASDIPQPHTIEQFKQVFADGMNHKNTKIGAYWILKAQVESCETNEDVVAIDWTL